MLTKAVIAKAAESIAETSNEFTKYGLNLSKTSMLKSLVKPAEIIPETAR